MSSRTRIEGVKERVGSSGHFEGAFCGFGGLGAGEEELRGRGCCKGKGLRRIRTDRVCGRFEVLGLLRHMGSVWGVRFGGVGRLSRSGRLETAFLSGDCFETSHILRGEVDSSDGAEGQLRQSKGLGSLELDRGTLGLWAWGSERGLRLQTCCSRREWKRV